MSARINDLRASNTSGVPGLRLNRRRGYLVIDVTWHSRKTGRRGATTFLAHKAPVAATLRAMERRARETGVSYEITARQAWLRLSQARPQ